VYNEYKVYGPYKRKEDGREHVILVKYVDREKKSLTVSFPKYKMELHLGRYLSDDETIDHDDGDFTNNDISNLKIMSRVGNASKGAIKVEVQDSLCKWCSAVFKPSRQQRYARVENRAGPFCSKSCSGKYGASVQNGGEILGRDKITSRRFSVNTGVKQYVN
jgi:hypothetical protein